MQQQSVEERSGRTDGAPPLLPLMAPEEMASVAPPNDSRTSCPVDCSSHREESNSSSSAECTVYRTKHKGAKSSEAR